MSVRELASLSDAELLEAWRGGHTDAGQELCERHYKSVERFLVNKVGAEQAVDLAQQAFMACVEARDRITTSFRAYLLTTAYYILCRHFRHRHHDANFDPDEECLRDHEPSPSSLVVRTQEQRLLLEALRAIPFKYQTLLELHYWEELSTQEIAGVLSIPSGTVRSRLQRARDALEAQLAALARSRALLESTLTGLDDWAARCRGEALGGVPRS
ncbi:MAG: sigma-70 family RNA polymerase sigma factor [Enhygromyxa sp.]